MRDENVDKFNFWLREMFAMSQSIQLPTEANPLTLMSGCRDSLSLSITPLPLPAAQLAFTLSLPGQRHDLRMRVQPEPIAGWLFPRGARRVCDRSPYKQSKIKARRSQNPPESAAAAASGPTTSGHRQIWAIFVIVSNIFGLNTVCLVSVSGVG